MNFTYNILPQKYAFIECNFSELKKISISSLFLIILLLNHFDSRYVNMQIICTEHMQQ